MVIIVLPSLHDLDALIVGVEAGADRYREVALDVKTLASMKAFAERLAGGWWLP